MKRRIFTALLGSALLWPIAVRAQQAERMRRVGFLLGLNENDPEAHARVAAFREGLDKLGWTEARNIQIDYRFAGGDPERVSSYVRVCPERSCGIA
jgi:putative tryptophan/tyrosine transport system substrate-binding protein